MLEYKIISPERRPKDAAIKWITALKLKTISMK
jgi:hypothetical protein